MPAAGNLAKVFPANNLRPPAAQQKGYQRAPDYNSAKIGFPASAAGLAGNTIRTQLPRIFPAPEGSPVTPSKTIGPSFPPPSASHYVRISFLVESLPLDITPVQRIGNRAANRFLPPLLGGRTTPRHEAPTATTAGRSPEAVGTSCPALSLAPNTGHPLPHLSHPAAPNGTNLCRR